ncbi:hypothetical protein WKH57_15380 [Niallia taxi]|uniref:hypothetical protein n=1 Tax=Niallia taxi TaxID=2499688 RepID=UPI00316D9724
MILCPRCNNTTEVHIERISIQSISFEWKKKGKGIKKKKLNPTEKLKTEVDRRLFISCTNCTFSSQNLSVLSDFGELEKYRTKIELIEEQLDSIKY